MAVAAADLPPEGSEFGLEVAKVARLAHPDIRLQLVVVDDDGDGIEPVIGGGNQRFPDLAFLQLSVAGHHEDAAVAAKQPVGEDHALGLGDAHAERARIGDDVRRGNVGVAWKAAEPAELAQSVRRQLPASDHGSVEARRVMTLGREEQVRRTAVFAPAQLVQQQPGENVERAEARPDMAGAGEGDHGERIEPAEIGEQGSALEAAHIEPAHTRKLLYGHEDELVAHAGSSGLSARVRIGACSCRSAAKRASASA